MSRSVNELHEVANTVDYIARDVRDEIGSSARADTVVQHILAAQERLRTAAEALEHYLSKTRR